MRARGAAGARPPAGQPRADGGAGGLAPRPERPTSRRSRRWSAARPRPASGARPSGSRGGCASRARTTSARAVPLPGHLRVRAGRPLRRWALLAALGRRRLLAAATLASFELEYSGRAQWLRRLPAGAARARTSSARLPARGAGRADGRAGRPPRRRAHRPDVGPAAAAGRATGAAAQERQASVAGAASRAGAVRPRRWGCAGCRRPCSASRSRSWLDQARSPVVPGANDNASGVAGVLELVGAARARAAAGARGDRAGLRLRGVGDGRDGAPGSRREGRSSTRSDARAGPRHDRLGRARRPGGRGRRSGRCATASRTWPPARSARGLRRWRLGAWTDPVLAAPRAGCPALSILSVRDGGFPNYHLPSDTPANVDIGCVEACVDAAETIASPPSAPPWRAWRTEPGAAIRAGDRGGSGDGAARVPGRLAGAADPGGPGRERGSGRRRGDGLLRRRRGRGRPGRAPGRARGGAARRSAAA